MDGLGRRRIWRPGCRRLAVALLAAVIAGCGTVAQAASPTTPRHAVIRSARGNAQAARTDAASLLASLSLPPGAVRQAGEPSGDDGTLAQPASGPPATPNAVDDHVWWVVPGTTQEVLQYVESRAPPGAQPGLSGTSSGPGKPTVVTTGFQWPPIPGELSLRWLLVAAVQLRDGSTAVRADSEVVWITPRPRAERIPTGARRIVVATTRGGTLIQGPITIKSRARLAKVISLVNALPAFQPGVHSCPADFGWLIRLAFYRTVTGPDSSPLAVAAADPGGCGVVQLWLGGRREPALAGGYALIKRLSAALHFRLESGPPQGD
ncbi:MAG TPA: hypothetical protein VMA77_24960 [Solirubrobacteraceae bacterium]|nr:hypothetical protein [Solirubrobacteraceae bacterium]